jgi:hypothetical protein
LVTELLRIADEFQEVFESIKLKEIPEQKTEIIYQISREKIAEIVALPTITKEEKTKMLRALDTLNSFLESAINLLAFGKFTPTSFL